MYKMREYWYIWYEIYENDKPVPNTKGRYYYEYKYKANAERRAKQMWSAAIYDPRSGVLQKRQWVVSQTNPWEDAYTFRYRADAEKTLFVAKEMIKRYGFVTRADILDYIAGEATEYNFLNRNYGWVDDAIKQARIYNSGSIYILEFPRAMPIS